LRYEFPSIFSGNQSRNGETFGKYLIELIGKSKRDLHRQTVSIICKGDATKVDLIKKWNTFEYFLNLNEEILKQKKELSKPKQSGRK
jgi:hypothetical protein